MDADREELSERDLTDREYEVAKLICVGKTAQEIANELTIARNTVRTHTTNIYAKLSVHNKCQLFAVISKT